MTPRGHAAMVLPMIQSLLEETKHVLLDVDFFAFGKGPGSFTGNRIATSVIQGLAFGVNKPVAAVSTLQALAQGAYRLYGATQVLVGLDARKDQIYWGLYACVNGIMEVCIPDQVSDP